MKKEQKLSYDSSFEITEITAGCKMPENKEEVLIYTALNGDTEALCENATYLVAGTMLDCGTDITTLNGKTPTEKLFNAVMGGGKVKSIVTKTGFYSVYFDAKDIKHYQYLNPGYVVAWVHIPEASLEDITESNMMSVDDLDDEILRFDCISKTQVAHDISKAFKNQTRTSSVEDVRLDIFYNPEHGWIQEYIIVTYTGGAFAARNNNMNSVTATFQSIGTLINGGYYDEVKNYRDLVADSQWIKVDVSKYIK